MDLISNLSLSQLVMIPTRSPENSPPSLLDHLVTSHPDLCDSVRVVACDISDHDAVIASLAGARVRSRPHEITVRSTKHLNRDHLCLDLLTTDWASIYSAPSPGEKYDAWLSVWNGLVDQHVPLTRVKV